MARSKMDKMERNLAAGIRLRQSAKEVWNERRRKSQDAQFAWAIANWVPSEELARGINKVIEAKKKELPPIQFAKNWNGELQRIGFKAVWRHCQRYSTAFSIEDTRDAIAEVIASLWEQGKLEASLQQDKLMLAQEERIQFCRSVVNAYRRLIHADQKTKAETTLDIILGMGYFYQWRPGRPEDELRWIELKESLRQTLSPIDYTACHLILQGYSRDEVSGMLKMARRTLRRRLDRLPSGKLLRILRT